jgi:hypothetical protein
MAPKDARRCVITRMTPSLERFGYEVEARARRDTKAK